MLLFPVAYNVYILCVDMNFEEAYSELQAVTAAGYEKSESWLVYLPDFSSASVLGQL